MKRILVVDDNTEYLQVLSSVLSGDFDTIKATGVKEALDILQAVTVDAICSDFNMKDGTGLGLLEKIRHKGRRRADNLTRPFETAALIFRAAVSLRLHKPMTTCRDTVADWRLIYRVPFAFSKLT